MPGLARARGRDPPAREDARRRDPRADGARRGRPRLRGARAPGARTPRAARARRRGARTADRGARRGGGARRGARTPRARRYRARARGPRIAPAPRARRARRSRARHAGVDPIAAGGARSRLRLDRRADERGPTDHARDARRARERRRDRPRARAREARDRAHAARHRAARSARGGRAMTGGTASDTALRRIPPLWQRVLPWVVTLVCFAWLGQRIAGAAARQGMSAHVYLMNVFGSVAWHRWLALMIPYSAFFFLVDSTVVWRVVSWFNARVPWTQILPIRASAYIISILNEQVGKGAMALYLNRRHGVPGWEVGSSMLFIMFCELLYLTFWAVVGYAIAGDELPAEFALVPWVALGVFAGFALWVAFFRGWIAPDSPLRDKPI